MTIGPQRGFFRQREERSKLPIETAAVTIDVRGS